MKQINYWVCAGHCVCSWSGKGMNSEVLTCDHTYDSINSMCREGSSGMIVQHFIQNTATT